MITTKLIDLEYYRLFKDFHNIELQYISMEDYECFNEIKTKADSKGLAVSKCASYIFNRNTRRLISELGQYPSVINSKEDYIEMRELLFNTDSFIPIIVPMSDIPSGIQLVLKEFKLDLLLELTNPECEDYWEIRSSIFEIESQMLRNHSYDFTSRFLFDYYTTICNTVNIVIIMLIGLFLVVCVRLKKSLKYYGIPLINFIWED